MHEHEHGQRRVGRPVGGRPDVERQDVVAGDLHARQVLLEAAHVGGLRGGRPERGRVADALPRVRRLGRPESPHPERRGGIGDAEIPVDAVDARAAHRAARDRQDGRVEHGGTPSGLAPQDRVAFAVMTDSSPAAPQQRGRVILLPRRTTDREDRRAPRQAPGALLGQRPVRLHRAGRARARHAAPHARLGCRTRALPADLRVPHARVRDHLGLLLEVRRARLPADGARDHRHPPARTSSSRRCGR